MAEKSEKKSQNSEEEYNDALVTDDPTQDSVDLEKMAKEAIKKFKSLG